MDHKTTIAAKRSRDARVVRSRKALREGLITLLQWHDLADVTVQMIVAEAGVGYATFFRHYTGVEALLIDLANTMITGFISAAMPVIAAGDRDAVLATLSAFVEPRRGSVRALLVGGGATVRREITSRAVAQACDLPLDFDTSLPLPLAVTHAVSASIEVLAWWAGSDAPTNRAALAGLIERLALRPLLPEA